MSAACPLAAVPAIRGCCENLADAIVLLLRERRYSNTETTTTHKAPPPAATATMILVEGADEEDDCDVGAVRTLDALLGDTSDDDVDRVVSVLVVVMGT